LVNPCKILELDEEKCEILKDFLRKACGTPSGEAEPELWKGRDLNAEWKELYKRISGG